MPDVGYLEVYLASIFSRLGHNVIVITSKYYSTSVRKAKNTIKLDFNKSQQCDGYQIIRLNSLIHYRSLVIPLRLVKTIKDNSPDFLIVIGITKMFAFPLFFTKASKLAPIISFFGDNFDMHRGGYFSFLKHIQRIILYRMTISKSKKIVFYTPSTESIIRKITGESFYEKNRSKCIATTLGFDDQEYFFDANLREEIREKLGIKKDEIVLILSTRIVKSKGIENIIKIVDECIEEGKKLKLIITGLFNDSYGNQIKHFVENLRNSNHFLLFKFLNHKEINGYFNCADIGVWTQAAISIQQGMGTGLFILIPDKDSVNHLVTNYINGFIYKDLSRLKDFIKNLDLQNYNRYMIVEINQKYNYMNLLSNLFNQII